MKNIILTLICTLCMAGVVSSQETDFQPVKYKKLKKEIKKKRSPFYYPALYRRYVELDTTLSVIEFRYLYYGYTFQSEYSPYGTPALQDSLVSYLTRSDLMRAEYEVAARIGGELLQANPFRLRETFITAVSYEMAGNLKMSGLYFDLYRKQVDAIISTGDGQSSQTAFSVIYVQDEYELLEVLGFEFDGNQHLLEGGFDMLELKANLVGIDALFFDVSRLLEVGF